MERLTSWDAPIEPKPKWWQPWKRIPKPVASFAVDYGIWAFLIGVQALTWAATPHHEHVSNAFNIGFNLGFIGMRVLYNSADRSRKHYQELNEKILRLQIEEEVREEYARRHP